MKLLKNAVHALGVGLVWLLSKAVGDVEIGELTNDYYGEDDAR